MTTPFSDHTNVIHTLQLLSLVATKTMLYRSWLAYYFASMWHHITPNGYSFCYQLNCVPISESLFSCVVIVIHTPADQMDLIPSFPIAARHPHCFNTSVKCTLSYWLIALQHTPCFHSDFAGNKTSLEHWPTSLRRLCAVFLGLTQLRYR